MGHTATFLPNGRVLIAGGYFDTTHLNSSELYDPATGQWTPTGSLANARIGHTATLLPSGKVLVAGGGNTSGPLLSAELYDPSTGQWTATSPLGPARTYHSATLLMDGRVLAAAGQSFASRIASAYLYNHVTQNWTATGSLASSRSEHAATLLANGKVLVVGGTGENRGDPLATSEVYDPATGQWTPTGSLAASRTRHTATLLRNGKVLATGGQSGSSQTVVSTAEIYDPATGQWTPTDNLGNVRALHTATLLTTGKVLVAGGFGITAPGTAELYGPAPVVATVPEGSSATQTGTFSDPDGNETVTLAASSGAITQNNASGTWSWTATGADGPASSTVTITATDTTDATGSAAFTFQVTNVASVVAISAPASANEDAAMSLTFPATDASSPDQSAGFAWSIDFGDGTNVATAPAGTASPLVRAHTFVQPGSYGITARATDKDGGTSAAATHTITIRDASPPVFTSVPANVVVEATSASGASVSYAAATATDNVDVSPAITYAQASGTLFPIGLTTVTVTASDAANNMRTATFTISVIAAEIAVAGQNGAALVNGGSSVTFDAVAPPGSSAQTFTISNVGTAALNGISATIDGPDAGAFSVTAAPAQTLAGGGASTPFTVTFSPGSRGAKNAILHIASSDFDENPFDVALSGTGANRAPLAGADSIERKPRMSGKVLVATLLANDSDPDGDPLTLTAVSAAAPAGATISRSGDYVIYEPPAGDTGAGSFTYIVTDGNGGSSIGTVAVNAVKDPSVRIEREGSAFRLFCFGIPGRTYIVQFTNELQTPNWQTLGTGTANAQGAFELRDTPPPGTTSRFYRTIYP